MPKYVAGWLAAVNDAGLATTTKLTDSTNTTYEEDIKNDDVTSASLTAIWDLGATPQAVSKVVRSIGYNDAPQRSLQYSTDGSSWTSVSIGADPAGGTCTLTDEGPAETTVAAIEARYWRLSVRSNVLDCIEQKVRIYEFRLLDGSNNLIIEPGGSTPATRRRGVQVI